MMKTILKVGLLIGGVGVIALQFIARPDRTNPAEDPALTMTSRLTVPADVRAILERSCNDCHSHRTQWPWYTTVAPASWIVADDVEEGREHLNFSEWGRYTQKRQAAKLEMISAEVDKGAMPLKGYLFLHHAAALSETDKDRLCEWASAQSDSLMGRVE
jgi:hypothetical protein